MAEKTEEKPLQTEEERHEAQLLSEMASMIDSKTEEEKEIQEKIIPTTEEKKQKPQMFLVRKMKPSDASQDDPNLTEEEKHKLLLEKML